MTAVPQESPVARINSLWNYQDPAASEEKFRALAAEAREADDAGLHAEALTQVARAQGLQRKFDDARRTLQGVEALLSDEPSRARVRYLLETGRVFRSSGDPEASRPYFEQAFSMATELKEEYLSVDAAHMLGIVMPPEEQIRWNLEALRMAEEAQDPLAQRWRGSLYNNLGWTYHDKGDYVEALDVFEKARAYIEKNGTPDRKRIARWSIARVYRSLERFDEALELLYALESEWEAAGETDGYVFEEIGECLLALGRNDDARPYFEKAYTTLSEDPWLVENEPERLERLQSLGKSE